ncbi:MAG: hypothetical protein AAGJ46_12745 [Planctomycetota bacterium]
MRERTAAENGSGPLLTLADQPLGVSTGTVVFSSTEPQVVLLRNNSSAPIQLEDTLGIGWLSATLVVVLSPSRTDPRRQTPTRSPAADFVLPPASTAELTLQPHVLRPVSGYQRGVMLRRQPEPSGDGTSSSASEQDVAVHVHSVSNGALLRALTPVLVVLVLLALGLFWQTLAGMVWPHVLWLAALQTAILAILLVCGPAVPRHVVAALSGAMRRQWGVWRDLNELFLFLESRQAFGLQRPLPVVVFFPICLSSSWLVIVLAHAMGSPENSLIQLLMVAAAFVLSLQGLRTWFALYRFQPFHFLRLIPGRINAALTFLRK